MSDNNILEKYTIVDQPLPDALNFEYLKNSGIETLKQMVGHEWSNYNESDPGVTILDQLCYALTELGYCAEFPIEDVLTRSDGTINYQDQFFEPQEILTCSPVTIDDYRKLVHDRIAQVRAIEIVPERVEGDDKTLNPSGLVTGRYCSYLSLQSGEKNVRRVVRRVYELLNQHRNLGELFLLPVLLIAKDIQLTGKVYLTQSANQEVVNQDILNVLSNYAAPQPIRSGYHELLQEELQADQIFNGPQLKQGWISSQGALKRKCSNVNVHELSQLIAAVDGVLYVESLSFLGTDPVEINIDVSEIANITLLPSPDLPLPSPSFMFMRNALSIKIQSDQRQSALNTYSLETLKANHRVVSVAAKVDLAPDLRQGKYRNIQQYYSVQNTFPDIYGIGDNSLGANSSNYRIAQSRQLKGYLMLFDQVLANQFSQLEHIGDLFSFKIDFKISSAQSEQGSSVTGMSTQPFALTYYSQPLYDVPDVKPLLRGNDAFHYQFDSIQSDKQVEQEAWKKFKNFPFNAYIHGLRTLMESESESAQRRDNMLSHLMARHGDDASVYDDMIQTCQWYGSDAKTRVVVKSIWLQNYQKLSYFRTCAFDFLTGNKLLSLGDPSIISTNQLLSMRIKAMNINESTEVIQQEWWRYPYYPMIDGVLDQARIYAGSELNENDFANFSTFELKANILLGLSTHLQAIATKLFALLDASTFNEWLSAPKSDNYYLPNSAVWVVSDTKQKIDQIYEGTQCLMDIEWSSTATRQDYQAHADQLVWLSMQRKGFLLIEHILLMALNKTLTMAQAKTYGLSATLIFPNYVTLIQQPSFQNFIDTLIELHWPAHISMTYLPATFKSLNTLIPQVISFNNTQSNQLATTDLASQLGLLPD